MEMTPEERVYGSYKLACYSKGATPKSIEEWREDERKIEVKEEKPKKQNSKERVQLEKEEREKKALKPKAEDKKEVAAIPKQDEEMFNLTREQLIEFGKECYAKGKASNNSLSKDDKENLFKEIVS